MKVKKLKINISNDLKELSSIFKQNNAFLFIVGGYVRDSILNKIPTDIDICSSLKIEEVLKILQKTKFEVNIKNKNFGTLEIKTENQYFEYTCFRKETYDLTGSHSPKNIQFISSITLDALRRDFYINAVYYNIETEQIVDPLNRGLKDLTNNVITLIKAKPNKFLEDATRILRMFKFAVQLNFKIDKSSLVYAKKYSYLVDNISVQRQLKEISFLTNCSTEQQQKFYEYLKMCDIKIKNM